MPIPRRTVVVLALVAAGCVPRPAPVPPPAPPPVAPAPPAPPPFTATDVWTSEAGVVLRGDSAATTLSWAFMHLSVLRVDSAELVVRCTVCRGLPVGRVPRSRVVWQVRTPVAARQMELADFALAVRDAALRRDYDALRRVMPADFTYSLQFPEGVLEAIDGWRGARAADLQRLPAILDRGVVSASGGVWAAPPEFVTVRGYADLRGGFRRGATGWEFIFLVRSEPPSGLVRPAHP